MKNKNKSFKNIQWRGFGELMNTPSFAESLKHEFKNGVTDDYDLSQMDGLSRRKFLGLLSASAALAGVSCSNYRDEGKVIPYNSKPEEVLPGKPNFFATTILQGGEVHSVLVKTREGRPIKINGNPEHPIAQGKATAQVQSHILSLYDPDRIKIPKDRNGAEISWLQLDSKIKEAIQAASKGGKEIAVITPAVLSPTYASLLKSFIANTKGARLYSYEQFSDANAREARARLLNTDVIPTPDLESARLILSVNSDFLGTEGNTSAQTRRYAKSKDIINGNKPSRLYMAEGGFSLTGLNADTRIVINSAQHLEFLLCLVNEICIVKKMGQDLIPQNIQGILGFHTLSKFAESNQIQKSLLKNLVDDLVKFKGKSCILIGDSLPPEAHMAGIVLNRALGNQSLEKGTRTKPQIELSDNQNFEALVRNLNAMQVGVLLNLGANPVYHLSRDFGLDTAIAKAGLSVSVNETPNETAVLCNYMAPAHHALESWGDAQGEDGIYALMQPVIAPLYESRQTEVLLEVWSGQANYSHGLYGDKVRKFWSQNILLGVNSGDFNKYLHDGYKTPDSVATSTETFNSNALLAFKVAPPPPVNYVVELRPSYSVGDGKLSNSGWLQEMPHPVSKIVWDNYAAVSLATAKQLGLKLFLNGSDYNVDLIKITIAKRSLVLPALVQPGMSDRQIVIELGYGRKNAGTIADDLGFDGMQLAIKSGGHSGFIYDNATLEKAEGTYELVSTQEHHAIKHEDPSYLDTLIEDVHLKRNIIQEGTVAQYQKDPEFLHHHPHPSFSIDRPHKYEGVKWALSVDLNKCTGCGDCVVSCTAENNVPVVGKDQVRKGREMQWIRIDRYYSGTPELPKASVQPMMCFQCDNAPCENVCPVAATTHSPEGINEMTYNRCVGTRYCANNCPIKTRRFNFFNFRDYFAGQYQEKPSIALLYNPEVTVRSRGVMEKCNFCVQRINHARAESKRNNQVWNGQGVTTACQEACSASAIVFGNINDTQSEIYRYSKQSLKYRVLEPLAIEPNVLYMAKLRNTKEESHL
jgi:molybdopterin-containing oxidoreductase family iron-sulfur binding subunit